MSSARLTTISGIIKRLLIQLEEHPEVEDTQILLDEYKERYPKYYNNVLKEME